MSHVQRPCNQPGCPALVSPGNGGRCPAHRRRDTRYRDRGTRQQQGYGGPWLAIRARVLREEPTCPCGRPATQVDHVQPLTRGGTHERDNLQGLCAGCHNVKTKRQAAAVFSGGSREKPRPTLSHAAAVSALETHPGLKGDPDAA